jgi:hypothetical protein
VLLALIGSQWVTITDEEGKRRLDDPNDFVRLEIEAALQRGVLVIPILVRGAKMPRLGTCLPASPSWCTGTRLRGCPGSRRSCGGGPRLRPAVW